MPACVCAAAHPPGQRRLQDISGRVRSKAQRGGGEAQGGRHRGAWHAERAAGLGAVAGERTHPAASSSTCILTRHTLFSPTGRSADRRGCAQGSQRAQKEELELEPGVGAGAGAGGCWRRSGLEASQGQEVEDEEAVWLDVRRLEWDAPTDQESASAPVLFGSLVPSTYPYPGREWIRRLCPCYMHAG